MKTTRQDAIRIGLTEGGPSDCTGENRPLWQRAAPAIAAAILAASVLAIGAGDVTLPAGACGRYQLGNGLFTMRDGNYKREVTLRIDTMTGETWYLDYAQIDITYTPAVTGRQFAVAWTRIYNDMFCAFEATPFPKKTSK